MMRQEQKRIRPGTCDRYILVIASRTLRDELKEEIRKMIPEIRDTGDIVTGIDLNGYLERPEYAHIEKEYRELWLHSGNYLEEMLSSSALRELKKRSNPKFKLMEKEKRTFVETKAFQEAIRILEAYQRVVISGDPGVGKTAHALCLADYYLCTEKYEAFYFVNSLEEIERIMGEDSEEKSVIVFDDFWGHSHFSESRLELNADKKMLDLFHVLFFLSQYTSDLYDQRICSSTGISVFPGAGRLLRDKKNQSAVTFLYTGPEGGNIVPASG